MELDNRKEPSMQDLVKRVAAIRNPEPEAPTEEPKAVDVSEDTPDEVEAIEEVEETEELVAAESEEEALEEQEELTAIDEEQESFYVEIDGEEIALDDIKEWKLGNLRQADYTRKTQEIADQRKVLETESEGLKAKQDTLDNLISELEAFDLTQNEEIDWADLREYDPSEYLKQKELQEQRQAALKKAKGEKAAISDDEKKVIIAQEQKKLIEMNPTWLDANRQTTNQYKSDMSIIESYLSSMGYTPEETAGITSAKHWMTILDAARFKSKASKGDALKKKLKKAPVVTKPKGGSGKIASDLDRQIKAAENKFKQTGRIEDGATVMRLKRQRGK